MPRIKSKTFTCQLAECAKEYHPFNKDQRFCSKSCARRDESIRHVRMKTGRHRTKGGYENVYVGKGYPGAMSNGYMPEHRYIMQESLGRPLHEGESVHHINGDKKDNRIENLQLRQRYHGYGSVMICGDCGSENLIHAPIKEHPEA